MATSPHGTTNKGMEVARLRLACAVPGDQPSQFLRRCAGLARMLPTSTTRVKITGSRRSLNQEAEDRAKALSEIEAEIIALVRLEEQHKGTGFLSVHGAPTILSASTTPTRRRSCCCRL
jgi:hypothetical protein